MRSIIALLVAATAFSCNKNEAPQTAEAPPETAAEPQEQAPETEPASAAQGGQNPAELQEVKQALIAYETIRVSLAKDETSGIAAASNQIAQSARAASSKVSGKTQQSLQQMAKAADELKQKADNAEEARKAFGDLSRPVVELISAHPDLQKGRYIFECPMAQGYQKWVQASETIENPYMGKKMLACGSKSEWAG